MFFVLFCCFFLAFFVFYCIKISKFALPGVMLMYERTSKDRKKERKTWARFILRFEKQGGGGSMKSKYFIQMLIYSLLCLNENIHTPPFYHDDLLKIGVGGGSPSTLPRTLQFCVGGE